MAYNENVSIIADDIIEGLPSVGTDVGTFLGNLAPGIGKFMLIIAVFAGVAGVIATVIYVVKKWVK